MAEIYNMPILHKGNKFVLKWVRKHFKPQFFGAFGHKYVGSQVFLTEELAWKICLMPQYIECPGKIACLLTREDKGDPQTAYYFVESEIRFGKHIWKQPRVKCCFSHSNTAFVPLMSLSDLLDEKQFPPECELTMQFQLQRFFIKSSCSNSTSAVTELLVTRVSHRISLDIFSPEHHEQENELSEHDVSENVENGCAIQIVQNDTLMQTVQNRHYMQMGQNGHPMRMEQNGHPMRMKQNDLFMRINQNYPHMAMQASGPPMTMQASGPPMTIHPSGPLMAMDPSGPLMAMHPSGHPMAMHPSGHPMAMHPNGPSIIRTTTLEWRIGYLYNENRVLIIMKSNLNCLFLQRIIQLFDVKNNMVVAFEWLETLLLKSELLVFPLYVPRNHIEEIEDSLTVFKSFEVLFVLLYHNKEIERNYITQRKFSFLSSPDKCSDVKTDLEKLYYNRTRANFCIKSSDGKTFHVHRCILAARSPVFEAMLQSDMLDNRTGLLEIPDVSSKVLDLFLKYIYTSKLEKNIEHHNVVSLYETADRYDIPGLLNTCSLQLMKSVSWSNFYDLLILSHLHRDVELRRSVIIFICAERFDAVVYFHLFYITKFDRKLTNKDLRFLRWIKYNCMKGGYTEEITEMRQCKIGL